MRTDSRDQKLDAFLVSHQSAPQSSDLSTVNADDDTDFAMAPVVCDNQYYVYTLWPQKNWITQLMVITLSKPNRFKKNFSPLERGVNCKQSPYNVSHHTCSMLWHYLWKVKVQICDKLRTRSTSR